VGICNKSTHRKPLSELAQDLLRMPRIGAILYESSGIRPMRMSGVFSSARQVVESAVIDGRPMNGRPWNIIRNVQCGNVQNVVIQVGWDNWMYNGEDEVWSADWNDCDYIEAIIEEI
jgi:hypothetical protein